ncbi:hypothetical protein MERGE_001899 [Pneumocystis wakefieldiae]|uniref:Succinate dehydrogenase [ubiquinone] cytochrome b small subunit n=1 Tax=Pneumocystis wakefieldiae TaxID=38082 RepID=A0A899FZQ1_9ASCO|nr:hypothetical protein MERGE_001899 [Pneumocystis wakefieldiae]
MSGTLIRRHRLNGTSSLNIVPFRAVKFHALGPVSFKTFFMKQGLGKTPPQVVLGSVNDPTPTPLPSPIHGSYHWTFERFISLSLVPLVLAPFVGSNTTPIFDAILSLGLVVHSYIGFDTCITDYFPKREYGSFSSFLRWVLRGTTGLVFLGLYEFETNDVGITGKLHFCIRVKAYF